MGEEYGIRRDAKGSGKRWEDCRGRDGQVEETLKKALKKTERELRKEKGKRTQGGGTRSVEGKRVGRKVGRELRKWKRERK